MNTNTDNFSGYASFHEEHKESKEHSDATNTAADALASLSNNFIWTAENSFALFFTTSPKSIHNKTNSKKQPKTKNKKYILLKLKWLFNTIWITMTIKVIHVIMSASFKDVFCYNCISIFGVELSSSESPMYSTPIQLDLILVIELEATK